MYGSRTVLVKKIMKKTQIIELFKNIKSTQVSFISIMMFVAIIIAVFAGFTWTSNAIKQTVNEEYNEAALYDFDVIYPYGFTEKNLKEIKEIEDFDEVCGVNSTYQFINLGDDNKQIKVYQLTENINKPIMVEGKLPSKMGEIAIEGHFAEKNSLNIGDTLSFIHDDDSKLATEKFTVTAIMESSQFISKASESYGTGINMIGVDGIMYVSRSSFSKSARELYPEVLIRSDKLRNIDTFSDEYKELCKSIKDTNADPLADVAGKRYNELQKEKEDAIEEIEAELDNALMMLENGEADLASKKAALKKGRSDLEKMKAQLAKAEKEFADYKADVNTCKNDYREAEEIYNTLLSMEQEEAKAYIIEKYKDGTIKRIAGDTTRLAEKYVDEKELREKIIRDINDLIEAVAQGEFDVDYVIGKIDSVRNNINNIILKIDKKVSDAEKELKSKKQQLGNYEKKLKDGEKKIAAAESLLGKGREEYEKKSAEAEEYIASLPELVKYDCSISARDSNSGFTAVGIIAKSIDKLRYTMAALFVIVGLLVCYSAVSRLVHDQTVRIGTKKALGLNRREVTLSYLAYAAMAVVIGAPVGLLVAVFAMEPLLIKMLSQTYVLESFHFYYDIGFAVLSVFIELIIILLCAWLACRSILRKDAIKLLNESNEKSMEPMFFEEWAIWKRMSLFSKTVIRNCITDKRRVFATLVGITGCTALIVCAVTMNDNLEKSFTKQFDEIFHYDTVINYVEEEDSTARKDIEAALKEKGIESTAVLRGLGAINMPEGKQMFMRLYVPTEENYSKFIEIIPTNKLANPEERAVWLSESYASTYGIKPGEKFSFMDSSGQEKTFEIAGFFEYYMPNVAAIISPEAYRAQWGEEPVANAIFLDASSCGGYKKVDDLLKNIDGYISTTDYYTYSRNVFDGFTGVTKALVGVYLALAVVMALLVLLNLFSMYIEEKRKEIVVMIINGFSRATARSYIYRDTILLTIIGIILGIIIGSIMGIASIHSIENSHTYFIKAVNWKACLTGAVATAVLSFAMIKIALRRVNRFELSDINK